MSLYQSLAVVAAQMGKKFASGTLTPADADVDVETGLAVVDHGGVSLAAAPGIGHNQSSALPSATAGNLRILSHRPTDATNPTPIDATALVAVAWWAMGD